MLIIIIYDHGDAFVVCRESRVACARRMGCYILIVLCGDSLLNPDRGEEHEAHHAINETTRPKWSIEHQACSTTVQQGPHQ